jgi:hypothetical protein
MSGAFCPKCIGVGAPRKFNWMPVGVLGMAGLGVFAVAMLCWNFSGKPIYRVPTVVVGPGMVVPGIDDIPAGHKILIQRRVTVSRELKLEFALESSSTVMLRLYTPSAPVKVQLDDFEPQTANHTLSAMGPLEKGPHLLVLTGNNVSLEVLVTAK